MWIAVDKAQSRGTWSDGAEGQSTDSEKSKSPPSETGRGFPRGDAVVGFSKPATIQFPRIGDVRFADGGFTAVCAISFAALPRRPGLTSDALFWGR